jgi:hypothetical protein
MSPSSTSDSSTRESYLDDDLLGEGGLLPFQRLKLDDASDSSLPAPVGTNGLNGLINGQINRQTKGQATGQTNAQKGSVRLVIGIDYGTTFTGEHKASCFVRKANFSDRCCIRYPEIQHRETGRHSDDFYLGHKNDQPFQDPKRILIFSNG